MRGAPGRPAKAGDDLDDLKVGHLVVVAVLWLAACTPEAPGYGEGMGCMGCFAAMVTRTAA
jgi:hypothetical protein